MSRRWVDFGWMGSGTTFSPGASLGEVANRQPFGRTECAERPRSVDANKTYLFPAFPSERMCRE